MTRVAFLTDLHFDLGSRWEETLRLARWAVTTLGDIKPDVIAIGGDVFERRPLPIEVHAVAAWIAELADIAPIVGCYGNHDVPESLHPMNLLEARHPIRIVDRPELMTVAGIEFALLPWPRKAQLLAASVAHNVSAPELAGDALRAILRGFGARSDLPRCFVGHVQLSGARVSTGQPLAPGADFELSLQDLELCKADLYLCGHVHLPQSIGMIGTAEVLYGGSFRRTTFGETEEKSIVLAEFAANGAKVTRIPIPCTPMLLIDLTDAEVELPDVTGAEIRLRYEVKAEDREQARRIAEEHRDAMLALGALHVKLEECVISEQRARSPGIAKAKSLAEKLELLWTARGFEPGARREDLFAKANEIEAEIKEIA